MNKVLDVHMERKSKEEKEPFDAVKKYGNVIGELLSYQEVEGFFKHDINPALVDSKIEAITVRNTRGLRGVPFGWILGAGMIMLFGAIAYMIISGQLNQGTCQQQLNDCYKGQIAQPEAINPTTPTTPTIITTPTNASSGVSIR